MEMQDFEKRSLVGLEKRANEDPMVVEGYAAVFNSWSNDLGGFIERIDPKAFDGVLGKRDVRALMDHNWEKVLGRESAGTLELSVDERGLKYRIQLPETTLGRDLSVLIARGDIQENSFAFTVGNDEWREGAEGVYERTITQVDNLFEVSIVSLPAYNDAKIAARKLDSIKEEAQAKLEAAKQETEERNNMLEEYSNYVESLKSK